MWPSPSAGGANCTRDTAERAVRSQLQLISAAPLRALTSPLFPSTQASPLSISSSVSAVYGGWHAAHPGRQEQEISDFSRGVRVRCPQPLFGHSDPVPPPAAAHWAVPLTCTHHPEGRFQPSRSNAPKKTRDFSPEFCHLEKRIRSS